MYREKFDLSGRVAVVTGGGRGIGRATCEALAEAGAKVVVAEILADIGAETAKAVGGEFIRLDVTDPDAVTKAADDVQARLGRVDVLVNNAGMARNSDALATSDEEWRKVMDLNVNAVFWCARAFGKHMVAAKRGSVVNIGSMSGIIVNKPQGQAHYNASKAAVHLLTKSLACEWAPHGVRVNAIAPGYIATDMTLAGRTKKEWYDQWIEMTPMARCGEPWEIAATALFLAADASGFFTGAILGPDGGYTAW